MDCQHYRVIYILITVEFCKLIHLNYMKQSRSRLQNCLLVIACILVTGAYGQGNSTQFYQSQVSYYAALIAPGQDLLEGMALALRQTEHQAISVINAVGTVKNCWVRIIDNKFLSMIPGKLYLTSLIGSLDKDFQPHLHLSFINQNGQLLAGHLASFKQRQEEQAAKPLTDEQYPYGCIVDKTVQLSLMLYKNLQFQRKSIPHEDLLLISQYSKE